MDIEYLVPVLTSIWFHDVTVRALAVITTLNIDAMSSIADTRPFLTLVNIWNFIQHVLD